MTIEIQSWNTFLYSKENSWVTTTFFDISPFWIRDLYPVTSTFLAFPNLSKNYKFRTIDYVTYSPMICVRSDYPLDVLWIARIVGAVHHLSTLLVLTGHRRFHQWSSFPILVKCLAEQFCPLVVQYWQSLQSETDKGSIDSGAIDILVVAAVVSLQQWFWPWCSETCKSHLEK